MTFPWLAFLPASDDESDRGADSGGGQRRERGVREKHALRLVPGDDETLVARIRDGDAVAMDAMFTTYYAELVSFAASYTKAREAAEDVVQDVFVRVWERRTEWVVRGSVAQYLYGAVRNRALNAMAHERVVTRQMDQAARDRVGEGAANAGVAELEREELVALVTRVVDTLPPRCRDVFVLSRYRRLTQREIAATLGITVNTVNVQLGRALRALDEALRARE